MHAADNSSKLDSILNEYVAECEKNTSSRSNVHVEMEVRFKDIDRATFISVVENAIKSPIFGDGIIEHTINAASSSRSTGLVTASDKLSSFIRTIKFANGTSTNIFSKKTRVRSMDISDFIDYKISISLEQPVDAFESSLDAIVRFKNRISFTLANQPWRLDATAVLQTTKETNLSMAKKRMFVSGTTVDTYVENLDAELITSYELELEYVGDCSQSNIDFEAIKTVFGAINPQYQAEIVYQSEIYNIAKYLVRDQGLLAKFATADGRFTMLTNKVIALSKIEYHRELFPPTGYFLTEKADGVHCVVSINGNRVRILTVLKMLEFSAGAFRQGESTIADGEFISTDDTSGNIYLFDCMVFKNHNLAYDGFAKRVKEIENAANAINDILQSVPGCNIRAHAKKFVEIGDADVLEQQFKEVLDAPKPYEIDGLIITSPNESYRDTKNYKWKDYKHNTIDMTAVKCPKTLLGIAPYIPQAGKTLYLLFVGISASAKSRLGLGMIAQYDKIWGRFGEYSPIQFSPSINPYAYLYYHPDDGADIDRQLVEMTRNDDNTEWQLYKIRSDRTLQKADYGNDFRIAEYTYMNFVNKFALEDLWTPSSSAYFALADSDSYRAGNYCRRYAISTVLQAHVHKPNWIVDLACGRGADINRYRDLGAKNVLMMDIDVSALYELVQRKFVVAGVVPRPKTGGMDPDSAAGVDITKVIIPSGTAMNVNISASDLKTPATTLIARIGAYGAHPGTVNVCVCNFAVHYMCDDLKNMRNFMDVVSKILAPGGKLIFTVMDGASVFALLKDVATGEAWKTMEGHAIKYALWKKYSSDTLAKSGQIIAVKLPFTNTPYTEPLCNLDVLLKIAATRGLALVSREPMSKYVAGYTKSDSVNGKKLTEDDKFYTGLFHIVVLERTTKKVAIKSCDTAGCDEDEEIVEDTPDAKTGGSAIIAGDTQEPQELLDGDY